MHLLGHTCILMAMVCTFLAHAPIHIAMYKTFLSPWDYSGESFIVGDCMKHNMLMNKIVNKDHHTYNDSECNTYREHISYRIFEPHVSRNDSIIVIYSHGNGDTLKTYETEGSWNRSFWRPKEFTSLNHSIGQEMANTLGCRLLIYDYFGYGHSTFLFPASEHNIYHAADIVYQWVSLNYTDNHIHLIGRSLGSSATTHLLSQNRTYASGFLISPFRSILTTRSLLDNPYLSRIDVLRNEKIINMTTTPTAIAHSGDDDHIVPTQHSLTIYGLIPKSYRRGITIYHGSTHYDIETPDLLGSWANKSFY
jgi:hypothetical protein